MHRKCLVVVVLNLILNDRLVCLLGVLVLSQVIVTSQKFKWDEIKQNRKKLRNKFPGSVLKFGNRFQPRPELGPDFWTQFQSRSGLVPWK